MEEKDNKLQIKRLANDEAYFTNVFKKSEKLVSVIFYILSHINKRQETLSHIERIETKALRTHELSLETISLQAQQATEGLIDLQYQLLALESTLRVAEAAGVMPSDILHMLLDQLDSIQRYINNHYTKDTGYSLELSDETPRLSGGVKRTPTPAKRSAPATARRQRVQVPAGDISTDAYLVYSQLTDRAERIKTVLEAKPQATIKDIAEVITDVSEKTIQRELNSLIEKGQVQREGERRWSRYSVVSS